MINTITAYSFTIYIKDKHVLHFWQFLAFAHIDILLANTCGLFCMSFKLTENVTGIGLSALPTLL